MTPPVDERTAAQAAFALSGLAPGRQLEGFARIVQALLEWGAKQGWSAKQRAEFAAKFGHRMLDHWPKKEGRLQ